MILGIGHDITDIERVKRVWQRFGARFLERCFTAEERTYADQKSGVDAQMAVYAKRFAAKEACAKALRSGISGGILFTDIAVSRDPASGAPSLVLRGGALKRLEAITPQGMEARIHLSLSDEPPLASAFVVVEAHK